MSIKVASAHVTIRIEESEVSKLSEELFETLLMNFHVIITQQGKDQVISIPYEEYKKMSDAMKEHNASIEDDGLDIP